MKRIIPLLFSVLLVSCSGGTESLYPAVTAHRGCWIKDLVPENSLESVRMAARFHYPAVVTADEGGCVITSAKVSYYRL